MTNKLLCSACDYRGKHHLHKFWGDVGVFIIACGGCDETIQRGYFDMKTGDVYHKELVQV